MGFLSFLFGPRDLPNIYKPRELLIYELAKDGQNQ